MNINTDLKGALSMPSGSTPPPSYREIAETQAPPPLSRPELSPLTIDGNLIYPVVPPTAALYELTHELDANFKNIGVSRLCPSRDETQFGNLREKRLYDFMQPVFSSSADIIGKRQSCLSSAMSLRMSRGIFRKGWELYRLRLNGRPDELVFRIRPKHNLEKQEILLWEDANQSLVAVETVCIPGGPNLRPMLHIIRPLDRPLIDALVTAWCAKIWMEHRYRVGAVKAADTELHLRLQGLKS